MGRYAIRRDTWVKIPLLLIGVNDDKSYVELDDDGVHIVFGRSDERIPLAVIAGVEAQTWPTFAGLGVRIAAGGIGYVGSYAGVVRIALAPPQPFRVLFRITKDFAACSVSLEDAPAFMAELRQKLAARA